MAALLLRNTQGAIKVARVSLLPRQSNGHWGHPAVQRILLLPSSILELVRKHNQKQLPSGVSQPVYTATSTATADGQKP